jgi:hypothetical protein
MVLAVDVRTVRTSWENVSSDMEMVQSTFVTSETRSEPDNMVDAPAFFATDFVTSPFSFASILPPHHVSFCFTCGGIDVHPADLLAFLVLDVELEDAVRLINVDDQFSGGPAQ